MATAINIEERKTADMNASSVLHHLEHMSDAKFRDMLKSSVYRRSRMLPQAEVTSRVVIECLHDLCNGCDDEVARAWWDVWRREHPTIRQIVVRTFVGLLKRWVKEWKEIHWSPDARDEASFGMAKFLNDQEYHFPYI